MKSEKDFLLPKRALTKPSSKSIVLFAIVSYFVVQNSVPAGVQGIATLLSLLFVIPGLFFSYYAGLAVAKIVYRDYHRVYPRALRILLIAQLFCVVFCFTVETKIAGYPIKSCIDVCSEIDTPFAIIVYVLSSTIMFIPAYVALHSYNSWSFALRAPVFETKKTGSMIFPGGATEKECHLDWKKIAEISDADFGFDTPKEKTDKYRFSVRVILINDKNEMCVIESEKYGYMQIPGGGIEDGESIEVGLRRETLEETGWIISDAEPIGYILENRGDVRNPYSWDKDITYVFKASPKREVETGYTEDEVAEGFRPIWIKLDDFIAKKEGRTEKIDSYSGCFSDRRDLLIAKYYRKYYN